MPVCIAGRPRNGSIRTPKPDDVSISPSHRLAQRHRDDGRGEALDLGARHVDAIDLLFERARIGRQAVGDERAAGRSVDVLGGVEADVGEHGAHPPRLGIVALFERGERVDLAAFDPIERFLEPREHGFDIALRGTGREEVDARVNPPAEDSPSWARTSRAAGAPNRAGPEIGDALGTPEAGWPPAREGRSEPVVAGSATAAQRRGALLEQRLPAHDLVELLLELFLVEQLAARHPVHLGAHLGDAVLIGELHFGLARDHAGEHVVLECEIGRGDHAPAGHDHEGSDHGPECHRADADLTAAMPEREDSLVAPPVTARPGMGGFRVARPFGRAGMLGATGMVMDLAAPVTVMILLDGIMAVIAGVRMSRPR